MGDEEGAAAAAIVEGIDGQNIHASTRQLPAPGASVHSLPWRCWFHSPWHLYRSSSRGDDTGRKSGAIILARHSLYKDHSPATPCLCGVGTANGIAAGLFAGIWSNGF
jgi:hypothetical protein